MKRRAFLKEIALGSAALGCGHSVLLAQPNQEQTVVEPSIEIEPSLREDWLARWERSDIDHSIATNRDFMWNQRIEHAEVRRIDGGQPDPRWKNSPGVLWTAFVPYDETLRKLFIANHNPASWGGLASTPWLLSLARA